MRRRAGSRRRRAAGFTLVELMISLVLVSLVVGMLMQSADMPINTSEAMKRTWVAQSSSTT